MRKKLSLFAILSLCLVIGLCGCRRKAAETESETETQTTEAQTETETQTEKETKKSATTEKSTTKKSTSTEKTTVKPSTIKNNTTTTPTTESASAYGTDQCPYCYQQISLQPNADGTTVYSVHVAQEKAWADTYGYGTTPPTEAAQTPTQAATVAPVDDSAQCPYCYQWFSVSDGSYNSHVASESVNLGGTDYVQCPTCGNIYPAGTAYDTHVCIPNP